MNRSTLKGLLAGTFKTAEKPLTILAGAAALTAILMSFEFNLLEAHLYDFRMSHGPQPEASKEIALITIDDKTLKALDEFTPLPLDLHARFMEKIGEFKPKGIGYLVDMSRVHQLNPELFIHEWGIRFVNAAHELESKNMPVLMGTPFDVMGEVVPPYPVSALDHSIALIHKDGNVFSQDKVTRRALVRLYDKPVFHTALAEKLGLIARNESPRGTYFVPEVDGHYFFFRYHGSTAVTPKTQAMPYPHYSFIDVLNGKIPAENLAGRILLVGTMAKEDSGDFAGTPYAQNPMANPKLAIHANILDSLIRDNGISLAPAWINSVITFLLTAFVFWWVMFSKPLSGVLVTLGLAGVFLLFAQLLFTSSGIWIRASQPLVGILVGYYLVVPYRLILEYKKRWDYQKRNELLVQVEELKTNFLQLVTHDLKTPVARIQGLAEVLLRRTSDRLDSHEKQTVEHIIDSTDELNRFITSILELNRVESNRIHIQLESKDVNQLVERAIESFQAQCRSCDVRLETELDPLFPIRVDAALTEKVIKNLIDNAIKYSPPGSRILIRTEEKENFVILSVSDEGIGLSQEEKEYLFTRFYRAKNEKTSIVPGTGLGLYLTKYFVELHHGRVEVVSELGKGSTFKICLPIEQPQSIAAGAAERPGLVVRSIRSILSRKGESHV